MSKHYRSLIANYSEDFLADILRLLRNQRNFQLEVETASARHIYSQLIGLFNREWIDQFKNRLFQFCAVVVCVCVCVKHFSGFQVDDMRV